MKLVTICTSLLSLVLLATTATAAPSLDFVDNYDGTVTLQIIPSGTGSLATEISTTVSVPATMTLTDVELADLLTFDTPNPGSNPFTSSVTFGLWSSGNDIFASFGSVVLTSSAPVDFLNISYTGTGAIEASGLIAEGGMSFGGLTASIEIVPEPSSILLLCLATLGGYTGFRRRTA